MFAREPGSVEMPSAARPFTTELVTDLVGRGVLIVPVLLHTGVSSLEGDERPYPERYVVSRATADTLNAARQNGGRVIAIGTTVVRALATVTDDRGVVHPGRGWTEVMVTPDTPVRVGRRPPHRVARTGVDPPPDARGVRRTARAGAGVPRRARPWLPVARVRRQPPHRARGSAAVTAPTDPGAVARASPPAGARCSTPCAGAARRRPSRSRSSSTSR